MRVNSNLIQRTAATLLLSSSLSCTILSEQLPAYAAVMLNDQEKLERSLYGTQAPQSISYAAQLNDAITIKTMRGVWELKEFSKDGRLLTSGTLTFRGDALSDKGQVTYDGDAGAGKGPWIIKADGFGRNPVGKGGVIEQKALWKLRRSGVGVFQYAGRVNVPGTYVGRKPDANVEGDIIELINGGKPKGGDERKIGRFKADLMRLLTPTDEEAAFDSAMKGGTPMNLQMVDPK